jgi:hypothetical protein
VIFDKIGGRKVGVTLIGVFFAFICPIVYKQMGIGETVTQVVLGVIAAGLATFGAGNAMEYKYTQEKLEEKP